MQNRNEISNSGYTSTSYNVAGQVVSTSSGVLPGYWDSVEYFGTVNGDKRAPNPHRYDTRLENSWKGSWKLYRTITPYGPVYLSQEVKGNIGGRLSSRINLPAFNVDLLYNRAVAKLYDRVRGSLDLSIAVAEASETKRMLNAMNQIEELLKDLPKKGEFFDWRKPLRVLGGRWLQWHLAIKPLIQDIYGSVDEFYRHKVPTLLEVNCKVYQPMPKAMLLSKMYSSDPETYAKVDGLIGVTMHVRFKDNGGFDLQRWTSLNPVSIAWELLPLSFVFDYFMNVSQFLRSLESSLSTNSLFVDGYWSKLYAVDASCREVGIRGRSAFSGGDTGSHYFYDQTASLRYVFFERSRLSSMPTPRLPTFVLPTSWQKLVTMASLLAVRLK